MITRSHPPHMVPSTFAIFGMATEVCTPGRDRVRVSGLPACRRAVEDAGPFLTIAS